MRALRWIPLPALLWCSTTLAQGAAPPAPPPTQQPEVLIPADAPMGGWGGPTVAYGQVNGQDALFVGGRGAWLIAHRFGIGGGGAGLVGDVSGPPAGDIPRNLGMAYGGVWLEASFAPLQLAHLTAGILLGGGGVDLQPQGQDYTVEDDGFFVAEPTLSLEVNVGPSVRADVGVTYRWVNGVQLAGLEDADLSGPTILLVVKFGSF